MPLRLSKTNVFDAHVALLRTIRLVCAKHTSIWGVTACGANARRRRHSQCQKRSFLTGRLLQAIAAHAEADMTQPIHDITLAIQQQRPFNSALDYRPESRTMPVISMQPMQLPSIGPSAVCTHVPSAMTTAHSMLPPMMGGGSGGVAYYPPSTPYYGSGGWGFWQGVLGVFSVLKWPGTWFVAALLVTFYQAGKQEHAPHPTAPVAVRAQPAQPNARPATLRGEPLPCSYGVLLKYGTLSTTAARAQLRACRAA